MKDDQILTLLKEASAASKALYQLFMEDTMVHTVSVSAAREVPEMRSIRQVGAGLSVMDSERKIYLSSGNTSEKGLIRLIHEAGKNFGEGTLKKEGLPKEIVQVPSKTPISVLSDPAGISWSDRCDLVKEALHYLKAVPCVVKDSLRVLLTDTVQKVKILDSEGTLAEDARTRCSLRVYFTVEKEGRSADSWLEYVRPKGWETFQENWKEDLAERIGAEVKALHAKKIRPGDHPVVFGHGSGGTFWHECCGHLLEAGAIRNGSPFAGMIGEKVASSRVTLIDDGTVCGAYGSSLYDDEGMPRRKNILIENGILKNYMLDRSGAGALDLPANGCGRRENYKYPAAARMSNTYLDKGADSVEEMIREIPYGLYVKTLGGGSGGSVFSILAREAYLIENGRITDRVVPCMLTGKGSEIMHLVDRVGDDLEFEMGSFCGASSGLIPVTASCPTMRISSMHIG